MCNNSKPDLANINAYAKLGHNSVVNLWELTRNKPNLDLVKVNAYPKFNQIPSILSQDIELKQNFDNNQGT